MEAFKKLIKALWKFFGGIFKIGFMTWVLILEAVELKEWCESDGD